jgi:hypothetical protein
MSEEPEGDLEDQDIEWPFEEAWVPLDHIRVLKEYQRILYPQHLARIVREFDPALFGTLELSHRDDGGFYALLDGQHRYEAMRQRGRTTEAVPCRVYHDLSLQDEAILFDRLNKRRTRKPLATIESFASRLIGEDGIALHLQDLIHQTGWEVDLNARARPRPGYVGALGTVERIYRQGRYGPEVAIEVLRLAREAWPQERSAGSNIVLSALGIIVKRYRRNYARPRLVRVLAERRLPETIDQAKLRATTDHIRQTEALAQIFILHYDRGLRRESRLGRPPLEDEEGS